MLFNNKLNTAKDYFIFVLHSINTFCPHDPLSNPWRFSVDIVKTFNDLQST